MGWLERRMARLILRRRGSDPKDREQAAVEMAVALTLWAYLFLLILTLVIGRSVGSALFLGRFDGQGLALLYVLVGLAVACLTTALGRMGRRVTPGRLAGATLLGVYSLTLGAGILLPRLGGGDHALLYGTLYLLLESFAFISTLQFWALANSALSFEQASRLYVFVGTGGIFGSIVGGGLTRLLAGEAAGRLFLIIASLVPAQLMALLVFVLLSERLRRGAPKQAEGWNLDHTLASVTTNATTRSVESRSSPVASRAGCTEKDAGAPGPLAFHFGLVSLLMVFATTLVDYYYKMFADRQYSGDVRSLTAFFGGFYVSVGLTTLLAQTVITPWILRRRSAFAGLLTSPVVLAVGAVANWFCPGLASATTFKLTDSVLTHSVYRSCQEVLYTPLPTNWAPRFKYLSDGVMGRYGLLLAGLFLIPISPLLDRHGAQWLLPILLVALAAWTVGVFALRREFRVRTGSALDRDARKSPNSRREGAIATQSAAQSITTQHVTIGIDGAPIGEE